MASVHDPKGRKQNSRTLNLLSSNCKSYVRMIRFIFEATTPLSYSSRKKEHSRTGGTRLENNETVRRVNKRRVTDTRKCRPKQEAPPVNGWNFEKLVLNLSLRSDARNTKLILAWHYHVASARGIRWGGVSNRLLIPLPTFARSPFESKIKTAGKRKINITRAYDGDWVKGKSGEKASSYFEKHWNYVT